MYQALELKIVKCLNISPLGLLLSFVQPPPEAIDAPHIQNFICIYLPCIASKNNPITAVIWYLQHIVKTSNALTWKHIRSQVALVSISFIVCKDFSLPFVYTLQPLEWNPVPIFWIFFALLEKVGNLVARLISIVGINVKTRNPINNYLSRASLTSCKSR